MESHELQEQSEHAHHSGQKDVGLTMAIVAVLLAMATLLSHRAHTEEVKLQTQTNDQWGFYQAKHGRAYEFGLYAVHDAADRKDIAIAELKMSIEEECGVPAEPHDCTSPVMKRFPQLQQLLAESKASPAEKPDKPAAQDHGAPSSPNAAAPAEHPTAEHKKDGKEGAGTHEKPAKEAGVKEGATKIQERGHDMEQETQLIERRANFYDGAELFLEISIVLCSIALLTENRLYWKLSFISTVVGIAVAVWGVILK